MALNPIKHSGRKLQLRQLRRSNRAAARKSTWEQSKALLSPSSKELNVKTMYRGHPYVPSHTSAFELCCTLANCMMTTLEVKFLKISPT